MFNLYNFSQQSKKGPFIYELNYWEEAKFDATPEYILARMCTFANSLGFCYFETVSFNSGFTRQGEQVEAAVIYVQLDFEIPILEDITHPLVLCFMKNPASQNAIGTIKKTTDYATVAEIYNFYKKVSNFGKIFHIKHYPLRGIGLYKTLEAAPNLGLSKQELVRDEPFNILNYKIFNHYFYQKKSPELLETIGDYSGKDPRPLKKPKTSRISDWTVRHVT